MVDVEVEDGPCGGPPETHSNFGQLQQAATKLAEAAIQVGGNRSNGIYLVCGVVVGALEMLAIALTADEDCRDNPVQRVNNDTVLFAAILAAKTQNIKSSFKSSANTIALDTEAEFGPNVTLEALQIFERATGKNIDHLLVKGLVEAARDPEMVADANRQKLKVLAEREAFELRRRKAAN